MKREVAYLACLVSATALPCAALAASPAFNAELTRTSNGVVHVNAKDFRSLGYGFAYAYAQDNICMFADSVLTARGDRSRFFGAKAGPTKAINGEYGVASPYLQANNEESDFFFKSYLDIDKLKAGYAAGSQEGRDLVAGYVAGYNRFLKEHAGKLPAACNNAKWVRPISVEDMYLVTAEKALHASGEAFVRDIVGAARDQPDAIAQAPAPAALADLAFVDQKLAVLADGNLGSNGLALGKEVTANGRGILLGNPHYPWTSTDRFYQAHLTVAGKYDVMGVTLGGFPVIVIGFNKDIAWTHTVTQATHFTTVKLTLDPADKSRTTYLVDDKPVKMISKTVSIDILQDDGKLVSKSKTFYFSKHGALFVKPEAGLAWTDTAAYALADPNRYNTRLLDQWLAVGMAGDVQSIKSRLDTIIGLPWVNTVAADRHGNALYADASVVPHVSADKLLAAPCSVMPRLVMLDGAKSACDWGQDSGAPAGIFSPAKGPSLIRSDYVGNSNDSYWLANPKQLLNGSGPMAYSPLYGRANSEQSLRTRIGFLQLEEALAGNKRMQPSDVQALLFANRIYAAELILPELLQACAASTDATLTDACKVLGAWDKKANLDSRGALLFREFWLLAARIPGKWAQPFDKADPLNTPRGLAPAAKDGLLAALKEAAVKLGSKQVPLDGRLGDFQVETRNGMRFPLHGGVGTIDGAYNALAMNGPLQTGGFVQVDGGPSYIQTVTFDDSAPVAQAMLVYGQSTDPKSPFYADQLSLYSAKKWPVLPFTPAQVKADTRSTLSLRSR